MLHLGCRTLPKLRRATLNKNKTKVKRIGVWITQKTFKGWKKMPKLTKIKRKSEMVFTEENKEVMKELQEDKKYIDDSMRQQAAGNTPPIIKEKCLYLDCEFNSTYGAFISIALHNPHQKEDDLYLVSTAWLDLSKNERLDPWVRQNVIPFLGKHADNESYIRVKLQEYLNNHEGYTIYGDWPEDFTNLLGLLFSVGPNNKVPYKLIESLTMVLITTADIFVSEIPHNALEDAKA